MSGVNPEDVLRELDALNQRYETRLANQRQVIENLSTARQEVLAQLAEWRSFGRHVASLGGDVIALSEQAQALLEAQGEEL